MTYRQWLSEWEKRDHQPKHAAVAGSIAFGEAVWNAATEVAAKVAGGVVPFGPDEDVSPMDRLEEWMVLRMRERTAAAIRANKEPDR